MRYEWSFSTPEKEGLSSSVLQQVDDYIRQKRYRLVNSVLVVKNGNIVFEKYYNKRNETSRNNIKSIWKSILSIMTGICVDKGIINSLDDPVGKYLHEFSHNHHPYHKVITIRHLLTMTSGIYWNGGVHYHCPMITQMMRTKDWIAHIADIDMKYVPGRHFQYKEWDVILLSAVIGRACGGSSYDVAKEYLYEPLNITSGIWPLSPCGFSYTVMNGEEASDLSARDLAKIGLLLLNKGIFDGTRIVSVDYVEQSIRTATSLKDWNDSLATKTEYGYLWWLYPDGYAARGFGGQELNTIPDRNYITVIQATPTPMSKSYPDIYQNILSKAEM